MVHNQPSDIMSCDEADAIIHDNDLKKAFAFPDNLLELEIDVECTLISDSLRLLCALSIPEVFCPTPHREYLEKYHEENSKSLKKAEVETIHLLAATKLRVKIKPKITKKRRGRFKRRKAAAAKKEVSKPMKESSPNETALNINTQQDNVVDDGRIPCCSKSLLDQSISATNEPVIKTEVNPTKENLVKPKAKNAKRWFEDEKPVVSIVSPNELMINGKLVVVDYSTFTKEADVPIEYECDEKEPPPLPGIIRLCKKEFCRLGCICKSIAENEIVRSRCQNVKCMFGCVCFPSSNVIDNDGDIRSRLRPRVSLLNWKHSDNTEKDTMANYKQLERGIISLRTKRTAQPPPRLRNEYVMDGVRNPLQPLPERNIRKRIRHKVPYFSLMTNKGNKKPGELITSQANKKIKEETRHPNDARPNLMQKGGFSDEPVSSMHTNGENETDYSIPNDDIRAEETEDDCQIIYEEEMPTILYQKIGTTPDIKNDEFLKSSTNAITSYWSVKRVMKSLPPREQVRRHDGRMVFVSWTATKSSPKVIPRQINPDRSINGDRVILPLLPENSEWLMYEFPKHYEKSSCISFTDIGLIIFTKVLIFQKIKCEMNNSVVKLKLKHHERKDAMSTISLYLLPRVGNLVVLGPMKKDICKSTKVTFPQTLSYIRHIHRNNSFGSTHFWDLSYSMNQEKLAEPFHRYIQKKKKEDEDVSTGRSVEPEVMEQIIPELMETYEKDEIPAPFRPRPSLRKKNVMQLKWSDSIKCSANFHPRVEPIRNAVPLRRLGGDSFDDDVIYTSPSESEDEEDLESCAEISDHFSDQSSVITID